ncbi:MAG: 16S rRNA (cytosine(1402)-N(4))-methyltransferase RsmH [Candidatus Omnitrophica bacterium]|nr:16S rRNA (cytosine(1402)-N(4))-methyltransferase RsmH [Candidatus Omnitrophota bacterium]MBI5143706.1 16S rRNA (cytosine(1402)-N(4))-methyltransferase RsmH [Candidatus Omnitrophota bacterium]
MLKEVVSSLNLKRDDIVLDATIGGGGHAKEILKRIAPNGRLIGIDQDEAALKIVESEIESYHGSFKLVHDNFKNLDKILSAERIKYLDAILFDLGISTYQIEDSRRGFSIKYGGRLDMRMDPRANITAYDIVNRYSERSLSDIIERFGEERFHSRIARFIIGARSKKPIETSEELSSIIHKAVGYRYRKTRIDPATRTFQAIRIAVNDELASLEDGLKKAVSWLKAGARICVISFHSLEDRIVKGLFKSYSNLGVLKIVTKKPLRPSPAEIATNPRSRSGKLRVAERIE